MCIHSFHPSDKQGYDLCSICGTYYSHSHGEPLELYGNDYWSHDSGHSTIQEQVYNVTQPFGSASGGKNDKVMEFVPLRGSAVLEIACAPGDLLSRLGERFDTVYGVEVDPRYERELRAVCGSKPALLFGLFPAITEHLPEATLDCLIGLDVFEHVPDGEAFIAECLRLLKPGGTLILMSPFTYSDKVFDEKMFHPAEHIWIYSESWLEASFSEHFSDFCFDRWLPGHEVFACKKKYPKWQLPVAFLSGDMVETILVSKINELEQHQPSNRTTIALGSESLCPVCQTAAAITVVKKGQAYHRCPACDCVFTPHIESSILLTENNGHSARHEQNQDVIRLERLVQALGRPPEQLIDFGCGKGETTQFLLAQGIPTTGIDQNTPVQLNDLADASVDGIMMVEVIEHLYKPHEVFRQFNRVLKIGGVVYAESSFADGKDLTNWTYLDPAIGHCTVHSLRSAAHIAEKNGFRLQWLNPNACCFTKQAILVTETESLLAINSSDLVVAREAEMQQQLLEAFSSIKEILLQVDAEQLTLERHVSNLHENLTAGLIKASAIGLDDTSRHAQISSLLSTLPNGFALLSDTLSASKNLLALLQSGIDGFIAEQKN